AGPGRLQHRTRAPYPPTEAHGTGAYSMHFDRRRFLALAGAAVLTPAAIASAMTRSGGTEMFGLIGKMTAVAGQRDALAAILMEGTGSMPGCLSYIIAA